MTVRAACANGNLTTAATWEAVDATSYSNSESANSALTTSQVSSSTFTPGTIQIDGIGVKVASRAASPTGTITVQLTQGGVLVTGTNVTINVSDLPTCTATSGTTTPVSTAEGGWVFFKFAAPVTLLAATAYAVSAATSSASQVNLWSAATTNWSRFLRTTTTGAPVAGDDLIITGEWTAAGTVTSRTVTMDSTAATNYGSNTTTQVTPSLSICNNGTLSYGIAASTNYILQQSGYVVVYNGGVLNVGSSGSEIPRTSTAKLQFNCAADGNFGLVARNGATVNMAGLSRTLGNNTIQTLLAADAAAAATSLTTSSSTGWLNGDVICLAPTSQTSTQAESKALTADASGTTLTVAALTNAHSGTSPTQGEVGLLTRNVVMTAVTANVVTFFFVGATAIVSLSFAEFIYLSTAATGKIGINITTTTGSFSADSCSVHDCDAGPFVSTGVSGNGFSFTNCVFYNYNLAGNANPAAITATSATWTIDNCMFCGCVNNNTGGLILNDVGGTLTNCSFSGSGTTGASALELNEAAAIGTISGLNIHSNRNTGLLVNAALSGTISSCNFWRTAGGASVGYGISISASSSQIPLTFSSCNIFGNATGGVFVSGNLIVNLVFDNCTNSGDTTFSQTNGLAFSAGASSGGSIILYSNSWSVVSGIKTQNTNDFNFNSALGVPIIFGDDCIFNGTNLYTDSTNLSLVIPTVPFMKFQNFGQTANDNRAYFASAAALAGVIQTNTSTVYSTNVRSEQMTPATAAFKLQSNSILVATPSGKKATPVVQVQKNVAYAGNAARLVLKRQDSMGVTSDQVLATFSAGSGSWQALTGTSGTAPQDGVFEFVVDCDGTAGSIFLGDASASVA